MLAPYTVRCAFNCHRRSLKHASNITQNIQLHINWTSYPIGCATSACVVLHRLVITFYTNKNIRSIRTRSLNHTYGLAEKNARVPPRTVWCDPNAYWHTKQTYEPTNQPASQPTVRPELSHDVDAKRCRARRGVCAGCVMVVVTVGNIDLTK